MGRVGGADRLTRRTARLMLATDLGFLAYWTLVAAGVVPPERMFAGYGEPAVAAWNWSFLPLDLIASATGLAALRALRAGRDGAEALLLVSLTLTATAGGMALAYWALAGDFEPTWWLPNAVLLLFPLPLLARAGCGGQGPRGRRAARSG